MRKLATIPIDQLLAAEIEVAKEIARPPNLWGASTPNKENAMIWPRYNAEKRMTLVVDEKMEAVIDPIDMKWIFTT